jgi:hypothetical protein
MAASLALEQRIIVDSIRRAVDPACSVSRGLPVDWEAALELAWGQGLAPLVYSGLSSTDLPVPDGVQAVLRAGYQGASVRTEVWVEPTLRRALEALGAAGLEPVVLKGCALAYLAYPEPAHRTLSDVDLLLPPDQLGRASDVLLGLGFWLDGADPQPTHHLRPHHAPGGWPSVELHHHVLPEPNPYAIDAAQLSARSLVERVAGVEARVLAPTDALLLACVHLSFAHRYRWFPLRNLTDILAITTRWTDGLDWASFLETVRHARAAGAVYWPLRFAARWLRAPIPEHVLSGLAPPAAIRELMAAVAEPRYVMNDQVPMKRGRGLLYSPLVELSLRGGCPPSEQVGFMLRRGVAVLGRQLAPSARQWAGPAAALTALAVGSAPPC